MPSAVVLFGVIATNHQNDTRDPEELAGTDQAAEAQCGEGRGRPHGHHRGRAAGAGFGLTLGNALRRVLLSSLQGAAVSALQIDGVLHEFSSIPGVREDVTDIVLNVKDIAIKMQGDGPKRMTLRKSGPAR